MISRAVIPAVFFSLVPFSLACAGAVADCTDPAARVIATAGSVHRRVSLEGPWLSVVPEDRLCPGSQVRTGGESTALLRLPDSTLIRLDQHSTLTFPPPDMKGRRIVDTLKGAFSFFTRTRRGLDVRTPFVNAGVDGTEFIVAVGDDSASVLLLDGSLRVVSGGEALPLSAGESVTARSGAPRLIATRAVSADSVQWILHHPPVFAPGDAGTQGWRNDVGRLLSLGRVREAESMLERVPDDSTERGDALSVRSVIALASGRREDAVRLADESRRLAPRSAAPLIALSYLAQSRFRLDEARGILQEAESIDPGNLLVHLRLGELSLAGGNLRAARRHLARALTIDPTNEAVTLQLGFVEAGEGEYRRALQIFEGVISRDPFSPRARLGRGVALVRLGRLAEAREELEHASAIDPGDATIRTQLARILDALGERTTALNELDRAERIDPLDPTPSHLRAGILVSRMQPVRGLQENDRSISLNGNRAVYRSSILLDEDLSIRQSGSAHLFQSIGSPLLALQTGYRSVLDDPSGHAPHRFLADAYRFIPRHEVARVSEQLQSQLFQPHAAIPSSPLLAESSIGLMEGIVPTVGMNEFGDTLPLHRLAFLASGLYGSRGTVGDQITQSGRIERFSYALSQFHAETDGFRPNAWQALSLFSTLLQYAPTPHDSVLTEFRHVRRKRGDTESRFDPSDYSTTRSERRNTRLYRVAARHSFSPGNLVGMVATMSSADDSLNDAVSIPGGGVMPLLLEASERGGGAEVTHHFRDRRASVISGGGFFSLKRHEDVMGIPLDERILHANLYSYLTLPISPGIETILGLSGDLRSSRGHDRSMLNPKVGVVFDPVETVRLRAALFRTFKRTLLNDQTLEPTQVAGFNQLYDDPEGSSSWRYGAGADVRLTPFVRAGAQWSGRDLDAAVTQDASSAPSTYRWRERETTGYLTLTFRPWHALTLEYRREELTRESMSARITSVTTREIPLTIALFPGGGVELKGILRNITQSGRAEDLLPPSDLTYTDWRRSGALLDASVRWRWWKGGELLIQGKNILDRRLSFQETDPASPRMTNGRYLTATLTISF